MTANEVMLLPGEREAIKRVLIAGSQYGYGNMIAHLETEWARMLMQRYGMSEESARAAAGGIGYPFDWDFGLSQERDNAKA